MFGFRSKFDGAGGGEEAGGRVRRRTLSTNQSTARIWKPVSSLFVLNRLPGHRNECEPARSNTSKRAIAYLLKRCDLAWLPTPQQQGNTNNPVKITTYVIATRGSKLLLDPYNIPRNNFEVLLQLAKQWVASSKGFFQTNFSAKQLDSFISTGQIYNRESVLSEIKPISYLPYL